MNVPVAPGYTPPRPLTPPVAPTNLGPVEPAPWDDVNMYPPTPPPSASHRGHEAVGGGAYAGGQLSAVGPAVDAPPYFPPPGSEAYPPEPITAHPSAASGYANGPGGYGGGQNNVHAHSPSGTHAAAGYGGAAAGYGYNQQTGPWSGARVPSPDSLLGRTAAKAKRSGNDPYDTETISSGTLKRLKRRGRRAWLITFLAVSALAAVVAFALQERQRLFAALGAQKGAVAEARVSVSTALQRAAQAEQQLAALQTENATKATASTEDHKLIDDLKAQVSEKDGEIETAGREVSVNLVDDIMFPSGKAELSLTGYRLLARIGKVLKGVPDKEIIIGGHTDDRPVKRGDFETNWELSAARAVNVARYFVEEVGLPPQIVSAAAYSEYRPRGKNAAKNRRIEVLLTPIVKVDRSPAK